MPSSTRGFCRSPVAADTSALTFFIIWPSSSPGLRSCLTTAPENTPFRPEPSCATSPGPVAYAIIELTVLGVATTARPRVPDREAPGKGLSRQESRNTRAVRTPEPSILPTTASTPSALERTDAASSMRGLTGIR
ncbi:MAG: hypothetical protein NT080_08365 [Spirochaetes bacterium]|nr:hypothetical protein [Spirochaetota bacterium]